MVGAEVPVKNARRSAFSSAFAACVWLCAFLFSPSGIAAPVLGMVPTIEAISSRLELTSEQEAQLRPLFAKRQSELVQAQLQLQQASTRTQKRTVLRDAKKAGDEFNSQVESLLTPKQKSEWREIRSELREKARERIEEKESSG
jgi:hypothetical protein